MIHFHLTRLQYFTNIICICQIRPHFKHFAYYFFAMLQFGLIILRLSFQQSTPTDARVKKKREKRKTRAYCQSLTLSAANFTLFSVSCSVLFNQLLLSVIDLCSSHYEIEISQFELQLIFISFFICFLIFRLYIIIFFFKI